MASNAESCSPAEKIGSVLVSMTKYANKVKEVRDKLAQISQVMGAGLTIPPRRRRRPVSTAQLGRRRGNGGISQEPRGQDLLHVIEALDAAAASASAIAAASASERSPLSDVERNAFTWSTLVEDTIKTMLSSMTVEVLNERMEIPCLPDEPLVEDLEGRDSLCFPSRQNVPANNRVIPVSILDELLDAPDEVAMSGVMEVEGVQNMLSRNDVDAARRMAYDAANDYLERLRAARTRRPPTDGPTRRGRYLHRVEGFRFFRSMEEAVMDITKAVMTAEGGCGAETTLDFQTPLESKREDWVEPEEDDYFIKCKLTEDILLELLGDTVEECKRVYHM